MKIVIIGTGNTATVLGRKLKTAGHSIIQVAGRQQEKVKLLADSLGAEWTTGYANISAQADLYLLAVADGAIATVANELPASNKLLVHTAASVSLAVLKEKTADYGVFYPLQSLNKNVTELPQIPVIIDASNEATFRTLKTLAASISNQIIRGDDEMRKKMHLAAVMVNNFTNHLFVLVEDYCQKEGLEFSLLSPLLTETITRLAAVSPADAQTGPALRNDTTTINKHLHLLHQYPRLKDLYMLFTNSISQREEK